VLAYRTPTILRTVPRHLEHRSSDGRARRTIAAPSLTDHKRDSKSTSLAWRRQYRFFVHQYLALAAQDLRTSSHGSASLSQHLQVRGP
jgi:hypothetical protein